MKTVKDGVTKVYRNDILKYKTKKENKNNLSPFGRLRLPFDEAGKLLYSFNPQTIFEGTRFPSAKYMVTNKGHVINLYTNNILCERTVSHGYKMVTLRVNNRNKGVLLHRLVAGLWCPNGKFKGQVHHIDFNKSNNVASNLVWVTASEHELAEKLFNEGDMKKYMEYIENIRKENEIVGEYITIPHPDYKEDECNVYYMIVSMDAYEKIKNGASTECLTNTEILGEYAICKDSEYENITLDVELEV